MRARRCSLLAGAFLTLALLGAPLAAATEISREEYVAQVEPICRTNTRANERILAGAKEEVKRGQLRPAAAKLAAAGAALGKTLAELRQVPQPTADQARLNQWLGYVKTEVELFGTAAKKLRAGDKYGAEAMVLRLNNNATLANNKVLAFEFTYCRFEPSRFL